MSTLIALVVRANEELSEDFMNKVRDAHPGMNVEFRDINPRNANETYEEAIAAGDKVIVVLRQNPLISDLLANGVPCIPILPGDGPLQQVADMQVVFKDYVPITS